MIVKGIDRKGIGNIRGYFVVLGHEELVILKEEAKFIINRQLSLLSKLLFIIKPKKETP